MSFYSLSIFTPDRFLNLRIVAVQGNDFLRAQLVSDVSIYEPEMQLFLDETGSDRRNSIRKHGYSLRGSHLCPTDQRSEDICYSFMSVSGMLDCKTVKYSVNGETFYQFTQTSVLPHLMTFNGVNPHSVLVFEGRCRRRIGSQNPLTLPPWSGE